MNWEELKIRSFICQGQKAIAEVVGLGHTINIQLFEMNVLTHEKTIQRGNKAHAHLLVKCGHVFFIFLITGAQHALENGGGPHTGQVTPELRKLSMKEKKHCCYTDSLRGNRRAIRKQTNYLNVCFCRSVSTTSIQQFRDHAKAEVSAQFSI